MSHPKRTKEGARPSKAHVADLQRRLRRAIRRGSASADTEAVMIEVANPLCLAFYRLGEAAEPLEGLLDAGEIEARFDLAEPPFEKAMRELRCALSPEHAHVSIDSPDQIYLLLDILKESHRLGGPAEPPFEKAMRALGDELGLLYSGLELSAAKRGRACALLDALEDSHRARAPEGRRAPEAEAAAPGALP